MELPLDSIAAIPFPEGVSAQYEFSYLSLIMLHLKYWPKNTMKNVIFGPWESFCTFSCAESLLLVERQTTKFWRKWSKMKWLSLTKNGRQYHKMRRIWSNECSPKTSVNESQQNNWWITHILNHTWKMNFYQRKFRTWYDVLRTWKNFK